MVTPGFAVTAGAINAALAVIAGAFGAHALRDRLTPALLRAFETGAQYHFYHALGLIAVGLVLSRWPESAWAGRSFYLMLTGIVLFCGSLYALALSGVGVLGAVTPLGGAAFIAAWICLALAARG
jgi:uncharacterized membrane protein YgdD (TMEM256/DUF423 family)